MHFLLFRMDSGHPNVTSDSAIQLGNSLSEQKIRCWSHTNQALLICDKVLGLCLAFSCPFIKWLTLIMFLAIKQRLEGGIGRYVINYIGNYLKLLFSRLYINRLL